MPPDDASLNSLGHFRLRLLPELAAQSRRIAQVREERDELLRQASGLAAQVRDLQLQIDHEQERLLTRGPIGGAALAGLDSYRRRQHARLDQLADQQARVHQWCRAAEAELQGLFAGLLRARRRLDVIGERIEQERLVLRNRVADAALEELVDDCVRWRR